MKRYDLYRLVSEQFGGGGNPPGGEGGQGGEGEGSRPPKSQLRIDPKLVTHRRFIGKPTRPEIGTDDRRPVEPRDIFGDLLDDTTAALDFQNLLDQWYEGDDSITVEQLREMFAALLEGSDDDARSQLEMIFEGMIASRGMEPDENGTIILPDGQTFNLVTAAVLLGLTIPLSRHPNLFAQFMSCVTFELGIEAAFTWAINNLFDVSEEDAPDLITNYINDTFGYLDNHPELQEYFATVLLDAYYHHQQYGSLDDFEPGLLSPDMTHNLFTLMTLQNASTIDSFVVQAAYFFNGQAATGEITPGSWDLKLHRSSKRTIRNIFGGNPPTFFEWLKKVRTQGFRAANGWTGARAFLVTLRGFFFSQILVMIAFEAGITFGDLLKNKIATIMNNNPEIVQALIDAGILVSSGDPRTGTDVTWSWDEDIFVTIIYGIAEAHGMMQPWLSDEQRQEYVDQMYYDLLSVWVDILDTVYDAGSWLWNLIMGGDSPIDPIPPELPPYEIPPVIDPRNPGSF